MAAAAETVQHQKTEIDQELRIRTDTATWLAETLHGSMQTSFEFSFDGQEIRGEDSGSLDNIFDEAIVEAREMVKWNPSLLFELRRRLIERQELDDMHKMAQGELPNTMVVVSDFPTELRAASEDVGGYNVSRQQTMLRVVTYGDGKFTIASQSLDGSNRLGLEAIYESLGARAEEGELLGQRINLDLPPSWQANLSNNLKDIYDSSLAGQFGGEWHAGIRQEPDKNLVNTYEFVQTQVDLLDWFTEQKLINPAAERLRYQLAATASARYKRYLTTLKKQVFPVGEYPPPALVSFEAIRLVHGGNDLMNELIREGRKAASRGEVYSGCGGTIKAAGLSDSFEQAGELGYGNKSEGGGSDKFGSLKFKCPNGHENTRPRNKLIDKCATCGTSVKC